MIVRILFIAVVALSVAQGAAAAPQRVGIAAIVNEEAITFADIDTRLFLYLGGQKPPTGQQLQQMRNDVLNKLIDERLQMQDAKSLGIVVDEKQLDAAFADIASKNNATPEQFSQMLTKAGASVDTLREQIRTELAWSQVVRRRLRPRVNISEAEIDNEITLRQRGGIQGIAPQRARPAVQTGGKAVVVALKQIVIPIAKDDPQPVVAAKAERAKTLAAEIGSCADMDARIKEFPNSGDIGRGLLQDLPAPIRDVVAPLRVGQISAPLVSPQAILLLMVCERHDVDVPANKQADAAEDTTPQEQQEEPQAEQQAAGYAVPGERDETFRENVANELGLHRLNQMAERYLRDLRAAAFIDRRL